MDTVTGPSTEVVKAARSARPSAAHRQLVRRRGRAGIVDRGDERDVHRRRRARIQRQALDVRVILRDDVVTVNQLDGDRVEPRLAQRQCLGHVRRRRRREAHVEHGAGGIDAQARRDLEADVVDDVLAVTGQIVGELDAVVDRSVQDDADRTSAGPSLRRATARATGRRVRWRSPGRSTGAPAASSVREAPRRPATRLLPAPPAPLRRRRAWSRSSRGDVELHDQQLLRQTPEAEGLVEGESRSVRHRRVDDAVAQPAAPHPGERVQREGAPVSFALVLRHDGEALQVPLPARCPRDREPHESTPLAGFAGCSAHEATAGPVRRRGVADVGQVARVVGPVVTERGPVDEGGVVVAPAEQPRRRRRRNHRAAGELDAQQRQRVDGDEPGVDEARCGGREERTRADRRRVAVACRSASRPTARAPRGAGRSPDRPARGGRRARRRPTDGHGRAVRARGSADEPSPPPDGSGGDPGFSLHARRCAFPAASRTAAASFTSVLV